MPRIELEVSDESYALYQSLGGNDWLRWHTSPLIPAAQREKADWVRAWVERDTEIGAEFWSLGALAFASYQHFRSGTRLSHRAFSQRLQALGFELAKVGGARVVRGLRLRETI